MYASLINEVSYLSEEVNRTELSPSVRVPWLDDEKSFITLRRGEQRRGSVSVAGRNVFVERLERRHRNQPHGNILDVQRR